MSISEQPLPGYLVVTDHLEANTGADLSDALQRIIDENPHRTIYFPDGEYILAKPICTPADPAHAVSLVLSDFATIKAADSWTDTEALIRLGGKEPYNTIEINGSNYGIRGGIIDGNHLANGISVDSGRETLISHVSIKHTQVGIHIKFGANSGSSDADIEEVNIVGNNMPDSIGVLLEGYDNTAHNMRIAAVQTGILLRSGGNSLRDIHPLFIFGGAPRNHIPALSDGREYAIDFKKSIGFDDQSHQNNWYSYCYSDQMATGFRLHGGATPVYQHCFALWYAPGDMEIGFDCVGGKFCAIVDNMNISFRKDSSGRRFLQVSEPGGLGVIQNPIFDPTLCEDGEDGYPAYLSGRVVHGM